MRNRKILSILVTIILLPFFIIWAFVDLGPSMAVHDIDLTILKFKHYNLDSTYDGSQFLSKNSTLLSENDSIILDSILNRNGIFSYKLFNRLASNLATSHRILHSTYFDRNKFDKHLHVDCQKETYAPIHDSYCQDFIRHSLLLRYEILMYKSEKQYSQAVMLIDSLMNVSRVLAESNLSILSSVCALVTIDKLVDTIERLAGEISDHTLLDSLVQIIQENLPDDEWIANALRLEQHNMKSVIECMLPRSLKENNLSFLFYIPPPFGSIIRRKFIDIEDSKEIDAHLWARIIDNGLNGANWGLSLDSPEMRWYRQGGAGWIKVILFKNTFGRIIARVAMPSYTGFFIDARRKNERSTNLSKEIISRLEQNEK